MAIFLKMQFSVSLMPYKIIVLILKSYPRPEMVSQEFAALRQPPDMDIITL